MSASIFFTWFVKTITSSFAGSAILVALSAFSFASATIEDNFGLAQSVVDDSSKAFGEVKGPTSVEDKQSALAILDTLSADDDYKGILCQVFALPGWVALLEKSKLTAKPTACRLKDLDDHILKKNCKMAGG